ncbi:thioredoxin [Delftia acidovorans]|uniref:thioredoxin n=1 Tax=Delftia acidovorans TaxID=80866 RepID=UPI0005039AB0|nr:thioredoxin [Delftia acidovorans]KFJ13196.1 thioredoxin [Delftia acidovorans]QQB53170.1 thioredoxin [Delftia acidovorans]
MLNVLTNDNFDVAVVRPPGLYAVRFWAHWCGPCRAMAPVYQAVAAAKQDQIGFGEVDLDQSPDLAARYGVQSIPTVLLFKNGHLVDRMIGAVPKQKLLDFFAEHQD